MNFSDYNRKNSNSSILGNLSPETREKILQEASGNININIGHNKEDSGKIKTLGNDIRNATQNISSDEQEYLESNTEYMGLMSHFMGSLNTYIQNQYLESFLGTDQGTKIGENLLDTIRNLRGQYAKDKDKIIEEKVANKYQEQFNKLKQQIEAQNQILSDPDVLNFIKERNKDKDKNRDKDFKNKGAQQC